MSLVEVSPSTVTQLNVLSVTRDSAGCSAVASTGASVVRKASNVAMSGWIIPAPLAVPPTVYVTGPTLKVASATLATVSVVMIARATSSPADGDMDSAAARIPRTTRSIGITRPITPVLHTRTSLGSRSRASPAVVHMTSASRNPCAPVHALALPAFTTIAEIGVPRRSVSWEMTTGAALTVFRVKTPAAAAGTSERITAMSVRVPSPSPRIPAAATPPRNPIGAHTPARACAATGAVTATGRGTPARPSRQTRIGRSSHARPVRRRPCQGCRSPR